MQPPDLQIKNSIRPKIPVIPGQIKWNWKFVVEHLWKLWTTSWSSERPGLSVGFAVWVGPCFVYKLEIEAVQVNAHFLPTISPWLECEWMSNCVFQLNRRRPSSPLLVSSFSRAPHSMPYAQVHYPFERKDEFDTSFPADFIAEGIDQTRGW